MKCSRPGCDFVGVIGRDIIMCPTGRKVPGSHSIREFVAVCGSCMRKDVAADRNDKG